MKDDLVDRLRAASGISYGESNNPLFNEAADEIERLTEKLEGALAALRTTQNQYEEMGQLYTNLAHLTPPR